MTYDLSTAKQRLGIQPGDTSQDAAITAAMATAKAIAETYCSRKFDQMEVTEVLHRQSNSALQLSRYPLASVESVVRLDSELDDYDILEGEGQILLDFVPYKETFRVTYIGGYSPLPLDLELALWLLFDQVWATSGGKGALTASDNIDSITVPDVGTIRFRNDGNVGLTAVNDPMYLLGLYRRYMV